MKKKHVVLIVIAILAVAGGAFAYSKRGPKPTEIEIATVAREDIQAKVTANGKVQATKKVDISATIPGQITLLAVKEGDRVSKGQLLLQIDATNPRAAARSNEFSMQALLQDEQSAQANLSQARTDLRRAEENFAARIIPEAEIQRAVDAVKHGGVTLGLGYNRRFHPEMTSLRDRIRSGELGTVLHAEATMTVPNALLLQPTQWRADRDETPCGGLTPLGVHAIDGMIDGFNQTRSSLPLATSLAPFKPLHHAGLTPMVNGYGGPLRPFLPPGNSTIKRIALVNIVGASS